jgi:endoglucanase
MNERFKPEVTTGAYGDNDVADERNWAACELYVSTRENKFLSHIELDNIAFELPGWRTVGWMGYYSLLRFRDQLSDFPQGEMDRIQEVLLKQAGHYASHAKEENPYQVVMGQDAKDFVWGSNSVAANQGIALIQAYFLTEEKEYLDMALANLDYIMGRNATGYSYVTGYGHKTPRDPHHRPSGAEPDKAPIPGLIVGGPNPGQQDGCDYESKVADESYVDDYCSYASNEIAINWSAPFAYLALAIEAIKGGDRR